MFKQYCAAIVQSFYNPAVYRDAIFVWPGFAGRYLAGLALLLATVLFIALMLTLNAFEKNDLPYLLDQVPELKIEHGQVSTKDGKPAVIHTRNKELTIRIDPKKSESELRDTKADVGIGKNFIFMQGNGRYEVRYLKDTEAKRPLIINKHNLRRLWDQNMPIVRALAAPLLWLGQFTDLIFKCLVVAVCSYLVTAYMDEEYLFLTRMRLSALALTPAILISKALLVFADHETAPWFTTLVALLYFYVMIKLMRRLPSSGPVDIQA